MVTGAASLVTFAAITILLRSLPIDEAGLFALSLALVETLSLVGSLGQSTLITRMYAGVSDDAYDWLMDLIRLVGLSVVPIGLGVLITRLIYPLSNSDLGLIFAAALLSVPVGLAGFMLNSKLHHVWGSLLLRLPNTLLILPALLAYWKPTFNNLANVLALYVLGSAASLALAVSILSTHLRRGRKRITLRQQVEGLVFLIPGGSYLLLDQGIVAIAGAFLDPSRLAAYAAIAILLRPFRLVASILTMVFSPQFIRNDRASYARPLLWLGSLAGAAGLAFILLGPIVADTIYGNRYSSAYSLIPWLALVGVMQVIRTVPTSHMAGRAPQPFINRVILVEAGIVAVLSILTVAALLRAGILGLAIGIAFAHSGRTIASFSLWHRFRRVDPAKGQPVSR